MNVQVRPEQWPLTRRRLLGLFALGGGSLALAACGGSAGTATTAPAPSAAAPSSAASSAPSPTAPATTATRAGTVATSVPAATTTARPPSGTATPGSAATATRAAGTPATATRGTTGTSLLLQMLRQVPQRGVTLRRDGWSFADIETQKRNYGFESVTSYAAFSALPRDQFARFNQMLAPLPTPQEIGLDVAAGEKPNPLAYTFWQIERAGSAGQPQTTWLRLEGRLDTAAIRAGLTNAGRTPTSYGGATILTRGNDNAIDVNDKLGEFGILGTFNRATLDDGALTAAPTTAAIEGSIDARAGRVPSLADDPDYLAVATALGPVVGATLVPAEFIYRPPAPTPRGTATATAATPATPRAGERLPPYRGFGVGMRDDGQTQTMVIALSYERAEDARAAGPLVRRRAEEYRLTRSGQAQIPSASALPLPLLRDLATPGEPQIVVVGARTVAVLPLAMVRGASLGLWRSLLVTSDYGFLTE